METNHTVRAEVLALLRGERSSRIPCFSGLISVTAFGLDSLGQHFSETHGDPAKMAAAVARAIESGVDAVWPGCDFRPVLPAENLRAMADEAHRHLRAPVGLRRTL